MVSMFLKSFWSYVFTDITENFTSCYNPASAIQDTCLYSISILTYMHVTAVIM